MRSSSRTIAWVVGGVWLFASAGAAANPLETELLTLINDHPDIRSAAKSYASAREGISVSRSDYFPTVKVNGDYGPTMIDTVGQKSISRHQKTAGVTITENLFDGFATTSGVEIAKLNAEVAELTLEGARQNTMLEGIRAYIDVLRQQRLIELSKNNEANIQAQLNLEDERVQRGAGVAVDVLQAKSRLQIAKERRVSFEGALEQAVARYIQVFNHAPDLEKMFDPQPPVDIIPPDLETAINHALGHNPAVANGAANVEVARLNRTRVRSQRYPNVDLVGSWSVEQDRSDSDGTRRDYSLLLKATMDLYPGGKHSAEERKAAFDYGSSRDTEEMVQRKVVSQTKIAWSQLMTTLQRVELLENAVNIASEVFNARRQLREAGKETVINVLDAESEIFNARINFVGSSYDQLLATYQLLLSMGELTEARLNIDQHG